MAGDVAGAATAFAELLEDIVRVLGPDHPDTLAARSNPAWWRGMAGDGGGWRGMRPGPRPLRPICWATWCGCWAPTTPTPSPPGTTSPGGRGWRGTWPGPRPRLPI
ncbi:hypothetical protein ACIG5E_39095 [Kitasatospora sp. NPDC053057]|uniref:hypothetical protein n=1 Tax=Kitasatospora sp. NPDC053057 TaxID=3364062 RepID=UPI0037C5E898